MKATEQKFRVVLFTELYARWFQLPKPMDDIRVRHQSSEAPEQCFHVVQFTAPCKVVVDESVRRKMALTFFLRT